MCCESRQFDRPVGNAHHKSQLASIAAGFEAGSGRQTQRRVINGGLIKPSIVITLFLYFIDERDTEN